MRIFTTAIFLSAADVSSASATQSSQIANINFCTGTEKIDFYPFAKMSDPRRIPMLSAILVSYIPKEKGERAILESWSYSEENRTFTGKVSKDARWQDGTHVSAKEAALGIAKGMQFRELGEKMKVAGTENINIEGWQTREYDGIKIIGGDSFELIIESSIKNVTGVLREALSTGSRHNRLWPARLSKIQNDSYAKDFDAVTKLPISREGSAYYMTFDKYRVALVTDAVGQGADLTPYVKYVKNSVEAYAASESHSKQSMIAIMNPKSRSLGTKDARAFVASLLRSAMTKTDDPFPPTVVPSHFLPNEGGGNTGLRWGSEITKGSDTKVTELTLVPGTKNLPGNVFGQAIVREAAAHGVKVRWLETEVNLTAGDVFVAPTRVENGRQIWLQDLTAFPGLSDVVEHYPKTNAALANIRKNSASTVPTDNATLEAFERAAFEEASIAPLGRFGLLLYSKKTSPVELVWTEQDELTFKLRETK